MNQNQIFIFVLCHFNDQSGVTNTFIMDEVIFSTEKLCKYVKFDFHINIELKEFAFPQLTREQIQYPYLIWGSSKLHDIRILARLRLSRCAYESYSNSQHVLIMKMESVNFKI